MRVNENIIRAKQIVIATGSSPFIPIIKGLDKTLFLTNETIFKLKEIPKSLVVVGGGPIGCELAQAFLRLGSKVSLIHSHPELLNKEESIAQEVITAQFKSEGMSLHLGLSVKEVTYHDAQFQILLENGQKIESEALLVSVGRKPNVSSLNLEAAGVSYTDKGIPVDTYGRTNQSHIWAVGDVIGTPSTALSVPGAVFLTLLGGYLFPQPFSTIYVVFSATCGATLIFLAARTALKEILKKKAGPFLQKMEKGFQENAVSYLLFLRFVPLFPFWLVNIAPAFFRVSLITFVWTTLVGIFPGSLVFTLAGGGLEKILENNETFSITTIFNTQIKIALVLLGIIALVPIIWKKFKKNNSKDGVDP